MAAPDLNDPKARAAYREELRAVGQPLRMLALAMMLAGAGLAAISRSGMIPEWIALCVLAAGALLMVAGIVQRTAYHRRRMRGENP